MPVQFADVNWEKEEIKTIQGHTKRREQRLRKQKSKKRLRNDIDTANRFFTFLFTLDENKLRRLLMESVHAFAFFMIVYESADDKENADKFVSGVMKAESLQRSELLMVLEWKDAFVAEGLYKDVSEAETRQDSQGDSCRQ